MHEHQSSVNQALLGPRQVKASLNGRRAKVVHLLREADPDVPFGRCAGATLFVRQCASGTLYQRPIRLGADHPAWTTQVRNSPRFATSCSDHSRQRRQQPMHPRHPQHQMTGVRPLAHRREQRTAPHHAASPDTADNRLALEYRDPRLKESCRRLSCSTAVRACWPDAAFGVVT